MNMQAAQVWPNDVKYLRDYEFEDEASAHDLRAKIKSSLHRNNRVEFKKIENDKHPAFGQ